MQVLIDLEELDQIINKLQWVVISWPKVIYKPVEFLPVKAGHNITSAVRGDFLIEKGLIYFSF